MVRETEVARASSALGVRVGVTEAEGPADGAGGVRASFDEAVLVSELQRWARTPIATTEKGFTGLAPLTPEELSRARPEVGGLGLMTPYVLLRSVALEQNLAAMARYCAAHGVELAPHAKTTMSPEIWAAHLRHGAFGLTAATPHQVEVLRAFGVRRILLANEIAGARAARWLAGLLDADCDLELCCYVDDPAGVAALDDALSRPGIRPGRRLPVLVELGYGGGRGGARDVATALEVARSVRASRHLALLGAAGFEGLIGGGAATPEALDAARRFAATLRRVGESLLGEGLIGSEAAGWGRAGRLVLSAGGSCFFDVVAEQLGGGWSRSERPVVVLRSGGYACHDHGLLARSSPFVRGTAAGAVAPALEVWSRVIARPEPDLALLDAGRRDLSTDADLPVVVERRPADGACEQATGGAEVIGGEEVIGTGRAGGAGGIEGLRVVACNDQHSYVRLADPSALAVGDLVALGISHCCTTFDKWRIIPMVDDELRVAGVAHTFF
ncbi:MAG TPA: alanine racemase [Acidimicrobiales bacterium]|nr:alanine racemase [Acidimicrobiales bacterium]